MTKKLILLLVIGIFFGFQLSANAQDMSVFGMKLGEAFTIKECSHVLKEGYVSTSRSILTGRLGKKKFWAYEYENAAPVGNPCFRRYDIGKFVFKNRESAGQLPPPREFVAVVSPAGMQPALAADDLFDVWILSDGRIDGVLIKFEKGDANEVFEMLKTKYGNKVKVTPMKWQNSNGATFEYFKAVWDLPKLIIRFQSAGLLFSRNNDVVSIVADTDNPFMSRYGQVSIGQKPPNETPPAKKVPF